MTPLTLTVKFSFENLRIDVCAFRTRMQQFSKCIFWGVGDKTALAFSAYVGDGKRFNNGNEVANYVGLVPRVDCSGTINKYGHITKKGE